MTYCEVFFISEAPRFHFSTLMFIFVLDKMCKQKKYLRILTFLAYYLSSSINHYDCM